MGFKESVKGWHGRIFANAERVRAESPGRVRIRRIGSIVDQPVSVKPEVFIPEALTQEFERLAARYQEMEFHKHPNVDVSAGRLKDMIMELVAPQPEAYRSRFDIPVIGFGQIPAEDQAKLAGVDYFLKGTNHRDWEEDPKGYKTPNRIYMTWMQDGTKNLDRNVDTVRATLDLDERGAGETDGIGLFVAKPRVLQDHFVDLPGTSVGSGRAAHLKLFVDRPGLHYGFTDNPRPGFGSASCGR